jgi:hypothetical protein
MLQTLSREARGFSPLKITGPEWTKRVGVRVVRLVTGRSHRQRVGSSLGPGWRGSLAGFDWIQYFLEPVQGRHRVRHIYT